MTDTAKNVDDYINNLSYDPTSILVNNSKVPTYKKEDGKLQNDGTFLVIKKKQCSAKDSTSELTYMDAIATRLYPGTMVLCNSKLVENNAQIVSVDTKPVKFNIDLPECATGFEVPSISKSSLDTAINEKLQEWKSKNPNGNIAAKVKYNA